MNDKIERGLIINTPFIFLLALGTAACFKYQFGISLRTEEMDRNFKVRDSWAVSFQFIPQMHDYFKTKRQGGERACSCQPLLSAEHPRVTVTCWDDRLPRSKLLGLGFSPAMLGTERVRKQFPICICFSGGTIRENRRLPFCGVMGGNDGCGEQ